MESLVEAELPQPQPEDEKFLLNDNVIKLLRYLAENTQKDVQHTVLFQQLPLLLSKRHSMAALETIKSILDEQHRERSPSDGDFGEVQHSYKEPGSSDVLKERAIRCSGQKNPFGEAWILNYDLIDMLAVGGILFSHYICIFVSLLFIFFRVAFEKSKSKFVLESARRDIRMFMLVLACIMCDPKNWISDDHNEWWLFVIITIIHLGGWYICAIHLWLNLNVANVIPGLTVLHVLALSEEVWINKHAISSPPYVFEQVHLLSLFVFDELGKDIISYNIGGQLLVYFFFLFVGNGESFQPPRLLYCFEVLIFGLCLLAHTYFTRAKAGHVKMRHVETLLGAMVNVQKPSKKSDIEKIEEDVKTMKDLYVLANDKSNPGTILSLRYRMYGIQYFMVLGLVLFTVGLVLIILVVAGNRSLTTPNVMMIPLLKAAEICMFIIVIILNMKQTSSKDVLRYFIRVLTISVSGIGIWFYLVTKPNQDQNAPDPIYQIILLPIMLAETILIGMANEDLPTLKNIRLMSACFLGFHIICEPLRFGSFFKMWNYWRIFDLKTRAPKPFRQFLLELSDVIFTLFWAFVSTNSVSEMLMQAILALVYIAFRANEAPHDFCLNQNAKVDEDFA